jgi:hypothetical protein
MIFVVVAAKSAGCQDGTQQAPPLPCEDQAPRECLVDTVEQATSSQFENYVYCACMTDDGQSRGYVAAGKNLLSSRNSLETPGNGHSH